VLALETALMGLHRRARLNAIEDDRKKGLMADPRHGRLTALSGIDFLPVAKLRKWEQQDLAELYPCYAVGASELQEHPLCSRCGYRPVEEPRDRAIAAELDELVGRLAELHADWTNALLTNLRQETTQANELMTPDQRKLVQGFLETETLPPKVSYDFVQTVREALSGLERVAVHGPGVTGPFPGLCRGADRGAGREQGPHCGGVVGRFSTTDALLGNGAYGNAPYEVEIAGRTMCLVNRSR